jgi:DNA-binding CsgD family transcriptional regulator
VSGDAQLARGREALDEGRWSDARDAFEAALTETETAEGRSGLASALWWLGESRACVEQGARAYTAFRRDGDDVRAADCAVWLAITYKSNFASSTAANGWLGRAARLLEPIEHGPHHGWLWIARAYRMPDLDVAEQLTTRALEVARAAGDVDLQLVALAQLGLIGVGKGDVPGGFALLDEAMAAVLAGERGVLDTVVYTCCDMFNACELADDLERAAEWCRVADDFVAAYGCPFLYAECRIYYGSVLAAKGRWADAERELIMGLRITDGCPGLHAKAATRLAALRIRQGRLEEADHLLAHVGETVETEAETALSVAALQLSRGEAAEAARNLERSLDQIDRHHTLLAAGLDLLVDAQLATGELDAARATTARLGELAATGRNERCTALASAAGGRVAMAAGDGDDAADLLESARRDWARLELPFETARARAELARLFAGTRPDVGADHARRALATFEELGATLQADRTAELLRSLGVNPRVGARRLGVLTGREQDVLELLGAGMSNPEIAGRLHISRKTASHHVSSILTKLDLRNRAQAAAFAASARRAVRDPE